MRLHDYWLARSIALWRGRCQRRLWHGPQLRARWAQLALLGAIVVSLGLAQPPATSAQTGTFGARFQGTLTFSGIAAVPGTRISIYMVRVLDDGTGQQDVTDCTDLSLPHEVADSHGTYSITTRLIDWCARTPNSPNPGKGFMFVVDGQNVGVTGSVPDTITSPPNVGFTRSINLLGTLIAAAPQAGPPLPPAGKIVPAIRFYGTLTYGPANTPASAGTIVVYAITTSPAQSTPCGIGQVANSHGDYVVDVAAVVNCSRLPGVVECCNAYRFVVGGEIVGTSGGTGADLTTNALTTGNARSVSLHGTQVPATTFGDVLTTYWAWRQIEGLFAEAVTTGCATSPPRFCPEGTVTRDQMAVFLVRAKHGQGFTPPAATGHVFVDVAASYWAAAYIEQAFADGITTGCQPSGDPGTRAYCPTDPVTRDQMAAFLERAKRGGSYTPPAATGQVFADVPASAFGAAAIEQLFRDNITTGCQPSDSAANRLYCPSATVTRAQMAVFLLRTFFTWLA